MRWEVLKKKIIITIIAMAALLILLSPTRLGPVIDKYNPFYKTKEYYTVVNDIGQHIGDGWYEYEFVAYDEKGRKKTITKKVNRMLKRNEPLKIFAKGSYGESIIEIEPQDIPVQARTKLLAVN
ncbi:MULTISPECIES: YxeA family protein [unclassified Bacillus cereus group]|uniref:YxeA family protein n=1 Tax=unclassified Bacillus cereus group TaxID=2750818 RepID=UPI0024126B09|nr:MULTISPECIES: YxeA family protein [unclassified Bacillus cereus group]